ncbi:SDR family NAD(P)-dependent oxidoreductase [Roseomonas elaeocarpi]|uniref:SDR family NAD(P)-dependent oxidoreductase n=1 Tax=Roseomonas elaeocarpi TaxID=907779 RepID=A0ABV6JT94_9PROT
MSPPPPDQGCAVVVGAAGGLGAALVSALRAEGGFRSVQALSRRAAEGPESGPVDVTDEASIAAAAARLARLAQPLRLVIVATGTLQTVPDEQPERSFRALDAEALLRAYRINAVGPALVAKHLLPLLPREGRSVFAALSARVGSIGDNRLGGWHGYRASKAALNMILRNLAIELARTRPEAICVGLHPGTVDTALSRPFQRGVPEGKLFTPDHAAACLLRVIRGLGPEQSGSVLAWDGQVIPP